MDIPNVFKYRKFWSALVGLVLMVAVNLVPELKPNAELLTEAILIVVGLLIGGYIAEDTVRTFYASRTK